MKISNRTLQSDRKIVSALEALRDRYSFTKFQKWNGHLIASEFNIGTHFSHALQKLGVIETKHGQVKLTQKLFTIKPSTIRKKMNDYVTFRTTERVATQLKVKSVNIKAEGSFNDIIIALKEQVRKEVLSELLASLK